MATISVEKIKEINKQLQGRIVEAFQTPTFPYCHTLLDKNLLSHRVLLIIEQSKTLYQKENDNTHQYSNKEWQTCTSKGKIDA